MPRAKSSPRHVALLRGINVGGHNKLPMATLRQIFADLGASEVETYIQSGNVVFAGPAKLVRQLPVSLSAAIADELGLTVPVVVRSGASLAELVAGGHPFADQIAEPKLRMVGFCDKAPSAAKRAAFDPASRSPDDFAELRGAEVFLGFPNGSGRSKLDVAWLDRSLGVVSTWRNWLTVEKLAEMAGA